MSKITPISLVAALFLALTMQFPSASNSESSNEILIYGNPGCYFCKEMRKKLDDAGYTYRFFDVFENDQHNEDMWKLVRQVDPKRQSVTFPVMSVNGTPLIHPSFKEVKKYLH